MRIVLALSVSVVFLSMVSADDAEHPDKLIDYLKPGMEVGLGFMGNSDLSRVSIMPDHLYRILEKCEAIDYANLPRRAKQKFIESLMDEHPVCKEALKLAMQNEIERQRDQKNQSSDASLLKDTTFSISSSFLFWSPARVVHVGSDFLLLESPNGSRIACTSRNLKSVSWINQLSFDAQQSHSAFAPELAR